MTETTELSMSQTGQVQIGPSGRGLTLKTLADATNFAKVVADSDLVPRQFQGRPSNCLLAMQHGAELGLGPIQSLQSIYIVNGRPSDLW